MPTITPLNVTEGWYKVKVKRAHTVKNQNFVACDMIIQNGKHKNITLDILLHVFSNCEWIQERDVDNVVTLYSIKGKRPSFNFGNIRKINGVKVKVYVANSDGYTIIQKIRRIK